MKRRLGGCGSGISKKWFRRVEENCNASRDDPPTKKMRQLALLIVFVVEL
jgi:hypothetical protein